MNDDHFEEVLEPDLPIIDPHHHLWDLRPALAAFPKPRHPFLEAVAGAAYYGFDHFHADAAGGHNIVASVFVECGAYYDAGRPPALQPVGEVEYANGAAARGASGLYGAFRPCAAVVGHAELTLGHEVRAVLEALHAAGGARFRGIRHHAAWDADPDVLGPPFQTRAGLYREAAFREGFAELGGMGLTFDAWVLEPQLPDVIDLARAFPGQPIVLDHCGTPLGIASYKGRLGERFETWRRNIRELAGCDNVSVKLGGLAMAFCAMPKEGPAAGHRSDVLADMWRPYVETCIEAFGTGRAMFESNYPVDRWGASYPVLWNAFKRLAHGCSAEEKRDLFAGTAARVYGLEDVLTRLG
jgi:predicted TIM-barrel fold metal-dependent hydrolase